MLTMAVPAPSIYENETIDLIHWLYCTIVYYTLQITCLLTVRIIEQQNNN